jgi:hypothetical protein
MAVAGRNYYLLNAHNCCTAVECSIGSLQIESAFICGFWSPGHSNVNLENGKENKVAGIVHQQGSYLYSNFGEQF